MTGGYEGVMGAASRGARDAGGRAIGVATPAFADRKPNDALHEVWLEPDYLARMSTLLRQGHAFVGLPGGLGTLSEWLAAVCLASIDQLGGPVVLFRDPWEPVLDTVLRLPEVPVEIGEFVRLVNNVDGLIEALERA
jgi:predicted Rossmann-fold nucleotide-binding protein